MLESVELSLDYRHHVSLVLVQLGGAISRDKFAGLSEVSGSYSG